MKLVAFDLDGTLLRGNSVCEVIAEQMGHLDRMSEFETYRDVEEIVRAREELVKYYQDETQENIVNMLEKVCLAPGLKEGVKLLQENNINIAIISITFEIAVKWFAEKLGIQYYVGTSYNTKGEIKHFWPEDKADWLQELAHQLEISADKIAAVGDSWGDVPMLNEAKYSYFVGENVPKSLDQVIHFPKGSILEISQHIIKT
ncbi:HAD family hydrolase [Chengkuizengella axinellae]|uniref:phosphoserine phosphatase n=1 Tax=Chengkuizengella axinellae TaxID=3064388 RepID=A0ABT9IU65_9BACL|nr:HAD-IB family phosphatase [Chengkuizengella sp. 2205SS18-9]MDP5272905.1 HAD-IB family phosphatase [Chengkuizengella sp. 2205SS18-9]